MNWKGFFSSLILNLELSRQTAEYIMSFCLFIFLTILHTNNASILLYLNSDFHFESLCTLCSQKTACLTGEAERRTIWCEVSVFYTSLHIYSFKYKNHAMSKNASHFKSVKNTYVQFIVIQEQRTKPALPKL